MLSNAAESLTAQNFSVNVATSDQQPAPREDLKLLRLDSFVDGYCSTESPNKRGSLAVRRLQDRILNTLIRFVHNREGWDGYRGQPLRPDTAEFAFGIISNLLSTRTSMPSIVPTAGGGVQFEWHEYDIDLELYFEAPYVCELWFEDHRGEKMSVSAELDADFSLVRDLFEVLSSRHEKTP